MSLTPASWSRHLPEVAESGERWRNIVCVKLGVSVFERCNSTSSLRPTEQPCVFGKILDLKSSANCRALSAIAGAGLSMFIYCIAGSRLRIILVELYHLPEDRERAQTIAAPVLTGRIRSVPRKPHHTYNPLSVSFSGHPFSRLCESSPRSLSCRAHFRSFCRRHSPCSRWPKPGVLLLSSMCRAFRSHLRYALLFVFVCRYISICSHVP